jgi:hypothetical protein
MQYMRTIFYVDNVSLTEVNGLHTLLPRAQALQAAARRRACRVDNEWYIYFHLSIFIVFCISAP